MEALSLQNNYISCQQISDESVMEITCVSHITLSTGHTVPMIFSEAKCPPHNQLHPMDIVLVIVSAMQIHSHCQVENLKV